MVDGRAGEMVFRHPMIKSVVVERSTHEERRYAHLRLADLFADQPERRGHHLAEATSAPDEDIAAAVEDGAHRTLQRGDVVGADHPAPARRRPQPTPIGPEPAAGRRGVRRCALRRASWRAPRSCCATPHRGDPTLGETLHAAVAAAYLLLNTDGDAETAHQLLTDAIESALDRARTGP